VTEKLCQPEEMQREGQSHTEAWRNVIPIQKWPHYLYNVEAEEKYWYFLCMTVYIREAYSALYREMTSGNQYNGWLTVAVSLCCLSDMENAVKAARKLWLYQIYDWNTIEGNLRERGEAVYLVCRLRSDICLTVHLCPETPGWYCNLSMVMEIYESMTRWEANEGYREILSSVFYSWRKQWKLKKLRRRLELPRENSLEKAHYEMCRKW